MTNRAFVLSFFILCGIKLYALNPLLPPSSNFDLRAWKIQALDSNLHVVNILSPELVAGYSTNYFYTNPNDGSMVFRVPSNGDAITGPTGYPRVELRQMTAGANWKLADTTEHYLTAQCKVISVATAKPQTIIGQIHGSENESEMLKLRWVGYKPGLCNVEARFEMNDTLRTEFGAVLATGLSLGDLINYTITMKKGTITVTVNGNSASHTYLSEFFGKTDAYYFKAGNYFSYNNLAANDPAVYFGQNQFYKLSLLKDNSTEIPKINLEDLLIYLDHSTNCLSIAYNLFRPEVVNFAIMETNGNFTRSLMNKESQVAGRYNRNFDLSTLKNGVYIARFQSTFSHKTIKIIISKQ